MFQRILLALFVLGLITSIASAQDAAAPPAAAASAHPRYRIETTMGSIVVEIDAEKAPISAVNFDQYVKDGYYKGTTFHRIIEGFMVQGGGFDKAYNQKKEGLHAPIKNEWQNGLKNKRGTIAMARTGDPNSATSQFYINVVDNSGLDQADQGGSAYAVFGKVIEGMDVADSIVKAPKKRHPNLPSPGGASTPVDPILIKDVKTLVPLDAAAAKTAREAAATTKKSDPAPVGQSTPAIVSGASREDFLKKLEAKFKKKPTTTDSGLVYLITTNGTEGDEKATSSTMVTVTYTGRLLDGSEIEHRTDVSLRLNTEWRRLSGLREGLMQMKKGDKAILLLTPALGYGDRGLTNRVPPNSDLVFEVELKDLSN